MIRVLNSPVISNDQSLDRLLGAGLPVAILLWNGEGLPEDLNQTMIQIAGREAGQVIMARINVQENPAAARRFAVRRTPLLVGVLEGEPVLRDDSPSGRSMKQTVEKLLGRLPREEDPQPARAPRPGKGDTRPLAVSDATFERDVLQSDVPVLVDFWASWCGPCHMISPVVEKLAREFAGRLRVAKVNVDESPHYAGVYGVQGIPTLLLMRNGKIIDRLVGVVPEHYLRAKIEGQLLK